MFFYPEPEAIGHCITDVSPSYLTDGVFFTGRDVGPTHKRIAKQLSAIPREATDPVPQLAEINERTLDRWVEEGKAWHVDNCGRNAKALHSMMKLLPKANIDPYLGWKTIRPATDAFCLSLKIFTNFESDGKPRIAHIMVTSFSPLNQSRVVRKQYDDPGKVALFPRSEQYEYSYIRNSQINDMKKNQTDDKVSAAECVEVEIDPSTEFERSAFQYTETPIWWRGKIPVVVRCAVGHPDDYGYQRPDVAPAAGEPSLKNRSSLQNSAASYVPGTIYRQEHQDYIYKEESEENGDKLIAQTTHRLSEGDTSKDAAAQARFCECSRYAPHKSLVCRRVVEDEKEDASKEGSRGELQNVAKLDPRWNPRREVCEVRRSEDERRRDMSNVLRPYGHEIGTWYSVNKPTKLQPPGCSIAEGKRSKPEWHFSNL